MTPAKRAALLAVPTMLLAAASLAGCTVTAGTPQSSSNGRSPSASGATGGTSAGRITRAAPALHPVCHGRSVPAVVSRVEPSVVTVVTRNGLGSGIVYRNDIVLTDQHVVALREGQPQVFSKVRVTLADGSSIPGKVVGSDLLTDLAVIQVNRDNLPPLTFRTTLPRPGETVLAMGSPLGLSSSVTEGIVSALGRNLPASQGSGLPLVDLIQTDAPISPGNSGGALLDTCGNVVGVNEAYLPPQTGAVSLGFATPSVVAVNVADQLIAHGTAQHPYLGVQIVELTPQIAHALGTSATSGVVVVATVPGGPAAKAGVRRGDVITKLAGKPVAGYADLLGVLRQLQPGQRVEITVNRRGATKQLHITIGSRTSNG
jgi:S1-C subfamily serine protease